MRSWWKAVAEAWLRHAVPFDADPGGVFRPFDTGAAEFAPLAGRLEPAAPGTRIRHDPGTRPGARANHDWGLGYTPPAA